MQEREARKLIQAITSLDRTVGKLTKELEEFNRQRRLDRGENPAPLQVDPPEYDKY